MGWFDMCTHSEMIATIKLINTSIMSYNFPFVYVMRTLKIYLLAKFKYLM